ncbi:hypothetical protein GCM10011600_02460 [Pseudolysinimonas yzui]|uniref:SRPBCC family protein n=1 Tax=Pseudolysinimonas yzui TaxID=2708254 RepID=A0A8J3GMQ0_9MICO|nr:hypothetical protein GCM10011600_02460 [Pseudolysinimonas yzui]
MTPGTGAQRDATPHSCRRDSDAVTLSTVNRWERRVVVHATVGHPVEAVFRYLADPMRWHSFAPAVAFRRQIDPGPPRVGTRWMATDRIGPFRAHFIDQLEHLDENSRVVWLSSAPWNSRVEYACEASGDQTLVRADYVGVLSGALRWQAGWLPGWATHWILAQDFRRLDRLLTIEARAAERWRRHETPATPAPVVRRAGLFRL